MKADKEKWIAEVLDSMRDSQSAKPSAHLFSKIKNQLKPEENIMISYTWLRIAASLAIFIVALNSYGLAKYYKAKSANMEESSVYAKDLISDYQIYSYE